jgi:hypothetical protein
MKTLSTDEMIVKKFPGLEITTLGTLYFPIEVEPDIDMEYHGPTLATKILFLDEAMSAMTLFGIADELHYDYIGKAESGNHVYYVHAMYGNYGGLIARVAADVVTLTILATLAILFL